MVIICFCGHADKYHSTGIPNKCTKCEECQYFRPRGTSNTYSNNPITAKFDDRLAYIFQDTQKTTKRTNK